MFIDSVCRLIALLLDYRSVSADEHHKGRRMGCILNLLVGCSFSGSILGYTGMFWGILWCTGVYWDVLGYTRMYWGILGCTGVYCGILGCTGIYWGILGAGVWGILGV